MTLPRLLARDSRWRHWLVGLCLGGLLVLGLATVRDYGMSYDAQPSREIGMTSLRYVADKVNPGFVTQPSQWGNFAYFNVPLAQFKDRDYGVAYELPVTLAERLLELPDTRSVFIFRHLCTFLVSWVGVLALYGLGRRRYGGDWRAGLAAAALLVLSPRLFGEFFYNDKDAVFLALSTVATYTTVRFVERPTWRWACLHALACALAIDVRLMAVLWPLATLVLVAWQSARGEYRAVGSRRQRVGGLLSYALLLPLLVVACWPFLWAAPWTNFVQAFHNMQHFRWDGPILYRGKVIYAFDLPWHYVPQWILITTPLAQLALLGLGLGVVVRQAVRRGWLLYGAGTREWQDLLFLGLGLSPLLAVIVLHSVLYDGWRQTYFIYPPLLLVALRGLVALWRWLPGRAWWQQRLVAGALVIGALSSAVQIVWMYPLESLYFNVLAGPNPKARFEQDYWGISYLRGLEWVLAHDDRPVIRVCTDPGMSPPLRDNSQMLPPGSKERIQVVYKPEEADYFLANYRCHPAPYDLLHETGAVRAGNEVVLSIFRLKW
ncbi:glycosyltransferase family 39 protein [Hymenobacter psoromatis]|uniref:glycosyltransferase family 39 protein n=1 Tax=Hymenobacter psoromatis TaxID=1484116 RepID=UPI001CC05D35|nr:glycosyltransferase family 39 protein [Hymenobacter psoromatis]